MICISQKGCSPNLLQRVSKHVERTLNSPINIVLCKGSVIHSSDACISKCAFLKQPKCDMVLIKGYSWPALDPEVHCEILIVMSKAKCADIIA